MLGTSVSFWPKIFDPLRSASSSQGIFGRHHGTPTRCRKPSIGFYFECDTPILGNQCVFGRKFSTLSDLPKTYRAPWGDTSEHIPGVSNSKKSLNKKHGNEIIISLPRIEPSAYHFKANHAVLSAKKVC